MKRGIHMIVSLLAVLLLAKPFDCFASGAPNPEVMDCCLKGKCAPVAKSNQCCSISASDGNQFVLSKESGRWAPPADAPAAPAFPAAPGLALRGPVDTLSHPPPSASRAGRSLPLLI